MLLHNARRRCGLVSPRFGGGRYISDCRGLARLIISLLVAAFQNYIRRPRRIFRLEILPSQSLVKMGATAGISLQVTVYIAPENVKRFFEVCKPVFDKVTAEPECTFFEIYQSKEGPGTLSWVEDW